ncbi:hypothetical protein D3C71_1526850 [compost metagenome]
MGGQSLRAEAVVWPGGWTVQGTPQVRPCRLGSRIHAADTPAQPTRPASDNFRVRPPTEEKRRAKAASLGGPCRAEPMLGCSPRDLQPSIGSALPSISLRPQKPPLLPPSAPPHEPVEAGVVWARGGVSAMDGAPEPPGMDSRRPPRSHTAPAHPQHQEAPALWPLPLLLLLPLPLASACRRHRHPIQ